MESSSKHLQQWTHNRDFLATISADYPHGIADVASTALHAVDALPANDKVGGIASHDARNAALTRTDRAKRSAPPGPWRDARPFGWTALRVRGGSLSRRRPRIAWLMLGLAAAGLTAWSQAAFAQDAREAETTGVESESPPPPPRDAAMSLFGGDEILWIAQARVVDDVALLRFAYREAGPRATGAYRALPIDNIVGHIYVGAVRSRDLHVFFRDGSHLRYAPSPVSSSRIALPMFTVELGLPDRAVPKALAWDRVQGQLVALVTGRDAGKIDMVAAERAARLREEDAEEGGESEPKPVLPAEPGEGLVAKAGAEMVLVFYDGFSWTRGRNGPAELGREDPVATFLVNGEHVHLVYSKRETDGALIHQFSTEAAGAWSPPASIALAGGTSVVAAGWLDHTAVLAASEVSAGGTVLRVWEWKGDQWAERTPLRNPAGDAFSFDPGVEAAVFGSVIAVAQPGKEGAPEIGTWSVATGEPMTAFETVTPLLPTSGPQLRPATRTFISYLVLMALLAGVVIWRRERIVVPAAVLPDQVFAALSARATAMIIDLVITAPAWGPLAFLVWSGQGGLAAVTELANPSAAPSGAAIWTPAIIGAIYAVYGAAFELAMRATPGKRIMRCIVVAEGGERCSAKAVLIRNAARVVEFHFAAVVLLVLLTPSRQRLGDILARTVVTQPRPPELEPTDDVETGGGPDDDNL